MLDQPPDTGSETERADFEGARDSEVQGQLSLRRTAGGAVRSASEGGMATGGRASSASFPSPDSRVSRFHTRIRVETGGAVWVDDLDSRNGTFVGRHRLHNDSRRAFGGDLVRIGPLALVIAQVQEPSG